VQLALLRGKVEALARSLRERADLDPAAPTAQAMLDHRRELLEQLREELAALQTGTDWHPQRVLDSLIDSTLAAAATPFRGEDPTATDEAARQSPAADRPRGE